MMSKQKEKKAPKKGSAADLIGQPDSLVKLLVKDVADQQFVMDELVNEGPPHKQGLTALLMQRSYKLVKAVEKTTGTSFELQKGNEIHTETEEEEAIVLPVALPVNLGRSAETEKIMKLVSEAPIHEILAYSMSLQAIEWCIKAIADK